MRTLIALLIFVFFFVNLSFSEISVISSSRVSYEIENVRDYEITCTLSAFLNSPQGISEITSSFLTDKTVKIPAKGKVEVVGSLDNVRLTQTGDLSLILKCSYKDKEGKSWIIKKEKGISGSFVKGLQTCNFLKGTKRLSCSSGEKQSPVCSDCGLLKCCIGQEILDLGTDTLKKPVDVTNPEVMAKLWGVNVVTKNVGPIGLVGHIEWEIRPNGGSEYKSITNKCNPPKSEETVNLGTGGNLEEMLSGFSVPEGKFAISSCSYPFIPEPPQKGPHTLRIWFTGERLDKVVVESDIREVVYGDDPVNFGFGERKNCASGLRGQCRSYYYGCGGQKRIQGYFSDCKDVLEYCCVSEESYVPVEDKNTIILEVGAKWEICDNLKDDDDDGMIDCEDSNCWGRKGPGGVTCCEDQAHMERDCRFAQDPCKIEKCENHFCMVADRKPCDPRECSPSTLCSSKKVCESADGSEEICTSCEGNHWDAIHFKETGSGCCGDDKYPDPETGIVYIERDNWCNINNGACVNALWYENHCFDKVKDCDEKAVDCGGTDCEPCVEECANGADDDEDGLVDCADPDCCGATGPKGGRCCNEKCECVFVSDTTSSDCQELKCGPDNECSGTKYGVCKKGKCGGVEDKGKGKFCDAEGGICRESDESKVVCECSGGHWDDATQECCGDDGTFDNWCNQYDSQGIGGSCVQGVWYDSHCADKIQNCDETKADIGGKDCRAKYGLPESLQVLFLTDSSGSFETERGSMIEMHVVKPLVAELSGYGVNVNYKLMPLSSLCGGSDSSNRFEPNNIPAYCTNAPCDLSTGCYNPASENWGPGIEWASEHYSWTGEGPKTVIVLADEGPYGGGEEPAVSGKYTNCPPNGETGYCSFFYYNDKYDKASVARASSAAKSNGVTVFGLWGEEVKDKNDLQDLFRQAAQPTGGSAFYYTDYSKIIDYLKTAGKPLANCRQGGICGQNDFCYLSDKADPAKSDEEISALVSEELQKENMKSVLSGKGIDPGSQEFLDSVRKGCLPDSLKGEYDKIKRSITLPQEQQSNILQGISQAIVNFFRSLLKWLGFGN